MSARDKLQGRGFPKRGEVNRNGSGYAYEAPCVNRDEDYAEACRSQGGFPVLVWINGEPRTIYRSEWAA